MSRTPMKLILTQEVSGLGAPGDVVDVAAGYGRNYLIPRGFAMNWTRGAEKQIELIQRARAAREIRGVEDARLVAGQLEGLQVRMRRRPAPAAGCSARSGPRTSRPPSARQAARNSTAAGSRSATRSRPWARTRSGSGCTPRSAPRSTSRSPPTSREPGAYAPLPLPWGLMCSAPTAGSSRPDVLAGRPAGGPDTSWWADAPSRVGGR